ATAPAAPRGGPTRADLALPDGVHPRLRAWALGRVGQVQVRAVPAEAASAASAAASTTSAAGRPAGAGRSGAGLAADGYAMALLAHIRHGGYDYTLAPGLAPPGVDALDNFWLERKQGFCEHYAVAFVVALRALGVPARVVTGYQGGHVNPVDGVFEVRQSDAHAWAEYWREGAWIRVDPTAAVAPERVRQTLRLRPPPGLVAGTLGRFDPGVAAQIARLRQLWSAADHRWNQWVLDHDRQRQLDLLRRLGWAEVDTLGLARVLLVGLAGLGLAGALWAGWDGRRSVVTRPRRDAWLQLWLQCQAELRRSGLALPAHATPAAAARQAHERWGDAAAGLADALQALEHWRYAPAAAGQDSAHGAAALRPLQRRLRDALADLHLGDLHLATPHVAGPHVAGPHPGRQPPGQVQPAGSTPPPRVHALRRAFDRLRCRFYVRTGVRLGW
ncbi:MAG: hypothetical protein RLZZ584_3460, partial [Pseudomonadota bacterium]